MIDVGFLGTQLFSLGLMFTLMAFANEPTFSGMTARLWMVLAYHAGALPFIVWRIVIR